MAGMSFEGWNSWLGADACCTAQRGANGGPVVSAGALATACMHWAVDATLEAQSVARTRQPRTGEGQPGQQGGGEARSTAEAR